jgi:hypothetical protein
MESCYVCEEPALVAGMEVAFTGALICPDCQRDVEHDRRCAVDRVMSSAIE